MAAPASVTIKDLSGTYGLNKTLSDNSVPLLKMQGIGFIVRQAVQYGTITVTLKQYTDDKGMVHLDQDQVTAGTHNEEERHLNWEWAETTSKIWGKVKGRNRFCKVSELEEDFLKEGWNQETLDGEVIESAVESVGNKENWTSSQVFGFAEVKGERKQVRRVVAKKGKEVMKLFMVYDWQS